MPQILKTAPLTLLILLVISTTAFAQEAQLGTDELYTMARNAAFEEDDYPKAVSLIKRAIAKSPDYLEMQVFLGRIYTYTDSLDQARMTFKGVLEKEEGHEGASFAFGNLEYWNDNSEAALKLVNAGIDKHPASEDLNLLKAKILKDLERYEEASATLEAVLKRSPKLTAARSLQASINSASAKNAIGASYEYVYFDKRFDDPWHLAFIDYARQTKLGSFTGRINYANRFATNALQLEVDGYPRISNTFYSYVNLGFSSDSGIFPQFRAGFSLFANLPASFEADAGVRYLSFSEETYIYTASVGKYYKNYWFNLRTYLTPGENATSRSLSLTVRYYLGGADDFFGARVGVGVSPDDNTNSVLFNGDSVNRLRSNNMTLTYRKLLGTTNVLVVDTRIEDQEYAADTRGIQFSASVGFIKRF